ncbi:hypothetical protein [Archangium lipolyticum]|uniref:hypothetical protein n=1 Tax=Archangium lipolyticum TaxID=2970465 RepID=UPI00214A5A70|nr:hypothetical protein [Archangium lipolyticum]
MGTESEKAPKEHADIPDAINTVATRLKSQPLLLALGVILVLAIVATSVLEALQPLLPAAVVVFALALVAWGLGEVLQHRGESRRAGGRDVRLDAARIRKGATVSGVDERTRTARTTSRDRVRLKARDVGGEVTGIRIEGSEPQER